ncbi:MAG TPA: response regulator transcription factor [Patescibacteria group bacterium]|nr:response regulator transcription factor [Patescibacteria group bacterium]
MRVLIVEDDRDIAKQLAAHLGEAGFLTHVAHTAEEGHYQGDVESFDLVLLDIGLPDRDGFSVLEDWRKAGRNMPVVIVTARSHKMETIRGLKAGADDYVTKPYDLDELVARIHANIRRHKGAASAVLTSGDVTFDSFSGKVTAGGAAVKLTRIEYLILQYLFLNQGKTKSATDISEHAYADFDHDSSIVARHISNIRKKLGPEIIRTDSNRGYLVPE